jgi:hypothetical protein
MEGLKEHAIEEIEEIATNLKLLTSMLDVEDVDV